MEREIRRKSMRLKGYDYATEGAYFLTICTHEKNCFFGSIVNSEMVLSQAGQIAQSCWLEIPVHFPHVELDYFVIMPNHIHGIITIGAAEKSHIPKSEKLAENYGSSTPKGTSKAVGTIVRGFKIGVTKWFRLNSNVLNVWQRNYHDHIIRDERSLTGIREYIQNNPLQWDIDKYHPNNS